MKILLLRSSNPFFESSASSNRYEGLIKSLIANGASITLIVTGGYNSLKEFHAKDKTGQDIKMQIIYAVPIFNHTLFFYRINKYLLAGVLSYLAGITINKHFKYPYDYIWITAQESVLRNFLRYRSGIKAKTFIELNEYNDVYKAESHISSQIQYQQAEKEDKIFLEALKKVDIVLAMTLTLLQHYRKLTSSRTIFFHLPMTVDVTRFSKAIDTLEFIQKPYIAFSGTFNNAKDGVDVLIRSFFKISNKIPHHLYLAGFSHWDIEGQKEFINKNGLKGRITYLGLLNKEIIPSFLMNADLLVLPRPDSHQARGGFPTKLGEYLATGKPVCVTKVGEIPIYLADEVNAFIALPGDVDSFSSAMERALFDVEKASKVGENGRKIAETVFNIEVQGFRLFDFLSQQLMQND